MTIAKKSQILISLVLVLFFFFGAILPLSADATDATWANRISRFPEASTAIGGYRNEHVAVIQRYFLYYDTYTHGLINNSGGEDGYFGTGTKNAVTYFQNLSGLSVDGVVGTNTWRAIAGTLSQTGEITKLSPGGTYTQVWVYFYKTYNGSNAYIFGAFRQQGYSVPIFFNRCNGNQACYEDSFVIQET